MPDSLPQAVRQNPATTDKAGRSTDDGKGRIFPCEKCGADLEFHIGQQDLKCPYCGFEKSLEISPDAVIAEQDFPAMLAKVREWREPSAGDATSGQSEVRCDGCGANVVFVGSLTSSECPYCGSPLQRDKVHDSPKRVAVHGVLAFQVQKETARLNLSAWARSRWFAPNEYRRRGVEGRFNGVYLPYWTYDSLTFSHYWGERGDYYRDSASQPPDADCSAHALDDGQWIASAILHDPITFKHLLLPVWLLAYRYHDKVYQVMINAVTGEVQGERPYSVGKILFAVLRGLAVVGGFVYFQQHGR